MTTTSDAVAQRSRPGAPDALRAQARRRLLQRLLMLIVPLAIALGGAWWYLISGRYVSTDDAYVQADTVPISSDVAGRLVEVDVHDNELVKRGQILFRLDDRPYRIAVERTKAELAGSRLQIDGLRASYRQKLADLKAAQDTLAYQQREFDRQQSLLASHVASQAQYDQARHNLDNARQQLASAEQQIANVLASLGGQPNLPTDEHPLVQQAQAKLDQAQLDLAYATVYAPMSGIVTKVDKLPAGTYLNAAAPAFSLVSTERVWIEANFKETELTHMQPDQAATVTVDAYPGVTFEAHVASLSPGTGSEFSVLPPQNATGNWVKVVQRLPVRLVVDNPDPSRPLRAGMSVTAEVDTHYRSPVLAWMDSLFGVKKSLR